LPEGAAESAATRTVFFGSGPFAVPILGALLAVPGVEVVAVVTVPTSRPSPGETSAATAVAVAAVEHGLPLLMPPSLRDATVITGLADLDASLGVLADYGRIVPGPVIAGFGSGILNVHPSLLPRWRGASPIAATIAAGDDRAGVTIISMDTGIDTGPIVAAAAWSLGGDEDAAHLRTVASERGAALLGRTIGPWLRGEIAPVAQDDRAATSTRPLVRDDGSIDGRRLPASSLERLVRALRPWPGCHLETRAGRLIVWRASVSETGADDLAGVLVREHDAIALATVDGRLVLEEVQPAGGRRMDGSAYLRGRGRSLPGTEVGVARTMDRPWMTAA
jgi:methionyl-tRNA formyltransferase